MSINGAQLEPSLAAVAYHSASTGKPSQKGPLPSDLQILNCRSLKDGVYIKTRIPIANHTTSDWAVTLRLIFQQASGNETWSLPTFTVRHKKNLNETFLVTATTNVIAVKCGGFEAIRFAY